jgi:hypothetical protein
MVGAPSAGCAALRNCAVAANIGWTLKHAGEVRAEISGYSKQDVLVDCVNVW